jgi:DNA gyrase inhibitor GyrI
VQVRVERLPPRTVAVIRGIPRESEVEDVRRPMYQHMVQHELVGGPSILRFEQGRSSPVDALVVTHNGFDGDAVCEVEVLPAGRYGIVDYEGPVGGLAKARHDFLSAVARANLRPKGPVLQVHHMDEVDGVTEQQFQVMVH